MGAVFETKGNILLIHLAGEIDHHCVDEIREDADHLIQQNKIRHVVFDYENVSFMDSSGVGFVMGRYKQINQKGGQALIIGSNQYIDKIFQMSGIYIIMKKMDSFDDACQFLKEAR